MQKAMLRSEHQHCRGAHPWQFGSLHGREGVRDAHTKHVTEGVVEARECGGCRSDTAPVSPAGAGVPEPAGGGDYPPSLSSRNRPAQI